MSFYFCVCVSLAMEYCQFSCPSQRWRSGQDVVAEVFSPCLLPSGLSFGKNIPGRQTWALREVICPVPGTIPLEMWELREGMCTIRDESQLFTSFSLSSTVLLDDVFIYKEKVYTLNLFLYRVCVSLSLAYNNRAPIIFIQCYFGVLVAERKNKQPQWLKLCNFGFLFCH